MEDWINAELGYFEPLDADALAYLSELMLPSDVVTPVMDSIAFHDDPPSESHPPGSDTSDDHNDQFHHNLWSFT